MLIQLISIAEQYSMLFFKWSPDSY